MPTRDYIPQDAELTNEEEAYFERHLPPSFIDETGQMYVRPDYIPQEPTPEDRPPEEKLQVAQVAAEAAVLRDQEEAIRIAKEKLRRMDVGDAVEFIATRTPSEQRIYLLAELDGQARKGILAKFPLPESDEE